MAGRSEGDVPLPAKTALAPGDLLASIRGAGGLGGLKKVQVKKDTSAPVVVKALPMAPAMTPMDALQRELDKRKGKVSNQSDDEDGDDDWND